MTMNDIGIKMEKLPEQFIPEVVDYIDFLLSKYGIKEIDKSKFKFDWEGGLSKLKNKYSSVELQHKALEWR